MNRKKAYDISQYPDIIRKKLDNIQNEMKLAVNGLEGETLSEPTAKIKVADGEVVYENENGSKIILGRDRTGNLKSGYGGRGDTQCASININVGMGANKKIYDESGNKLKIDPDFKTDPAFVYLSQKCDIDAAMGLAHGSYGETKTKSSIGLKADSIRIVSRENTKIVAGIDEKNSQGAERRGYYGIELIANNDDKDLQPIPKGNNTVECLQRIVKHVDELSAIVEIVLRNQMIINSTLAGHVHLSSAPGTPCSPSPELAAATINGNSDMAKAYASVLTHKLNSAILKLNYLSRVGFKYINSLFNKVN